MNHPTQQQKVSFSRPCPPSEYNPVIHIMPANYNDAASASVPFMAVWNTQKLEAGKEIHVQQHRIHDTDGISVNKKKSRKKVVDFFPLKLSVRQIPLILSESGVMVYTLLFIFSRHSTGRRRRQNPVQYTGARSVSHQLPRTRWWYYYRGTSS